LFCIGWVYDTVKAYKKMKTDDKQLQDMILENETITNEMSVVRELRKLAPDKIDQESLSYHYQDVNIHIAWQYGGHYGKSCKSIGVKRGDPLELNIEESEEQGTIVAVYWKGERIGEMKTNRLADMVIQWKDSDLPVFCAVSFLGGNNRIYFEFAFYGRPARKQ